MKLNAATLRHLELALVLSVAFASSLFSSLAVWFGGSEVVGSLSSIRVWNSILVEATALAVLCYVLLRQGRSLSDLWQAFRWRDLVIAIGLALGGYVAYYVVYLLIYYATYLATGFRLVPNTNNVSVVTMGVVPSTVLLMAINPVFEELIVRAYTMSELLEMGYGPLIAVTFSVLFQTTYHLYYGSGIALAMGATFLIYALYFAKTRRIMPVILAHMLFDFYALFSHAAR